MVSEISLLKILKFISMLMITFESFIFLQVNTSLYFNGIVCFINPSTSHLPPLTETNIHK